MGIDWTVFAFEALNFTILVLVLRRFLFRPVREALEERRRDIEARGMQMQEREAAAAQLRQTYEEKLDELEDEIRAKSEAATARAQEKSAGLIEEGREHAKELVATAGLECEAVRKRALQQLRLDVFNLAVDAATRVVQHMGAPSVALAYARRAAHDCQEILEGLDGPLDEPVALQTGSDVDIEEITAEVGSILGASVRIEASVDPRIVAGVRLGFAGHEVEASASMVLTDWYTTRIGETPDAGALERAG